MGPDSLIPVWVRNGHWAQALEVAIFRGTDEGGKNTRPGVAQAEPRNLVGNCRIDPVTEKCRQLSALDQGEKSSQTADLVLVVRVLNA